MRGRALVLSLMFALAGAVTPEAAAQDADYPPVLPVNCAVLSGDVIVRDGRILVLFEGRLTVSGGPGCARAREPVVATARSHPVFFGETIANDDGSYSITNRLPAHIGPGDHEMIVDFGPGRRQIVVPFTVVTSFAAGAQGILPRTGGNLRSLVLWSMVLLVAGVSLTLYTRRRLLLSPALAAARARVQPLFERRRHSPPGPEVPRLETIRVQPAWSGARSFETEVPRVDTKGFEPIKAEARTKPVDDDDWPFFTPPES